MPEVAQWISLYSMSSFHSNVCLLNIPSSQIACDDTGPERTLKELTRGHGGTCGSAYIDSNLRQLLFRKLGDCVNDLPACTIENVMEEFTEKVKVCDAVLVQHVSNRARAYMCKKSPTSTEPVISTFKSRRC